MDHTHRIVLVDRNADTRAIARVRLRMDGFDVVGEADEETALDVVAANRPDAIVVELDGPPVDALRAAAPGAAVVVFAWFADPTTLADALTHGADVVVDKAGGPGELSVHLRCLLDHPASGSSDLSAVRRELRSLADTARTRGLTDDERSRARRLRLVEGRLLTRVARAELSASETTSRTSA